MNWAEAVIVIAIALAGVLMFCSGYLNVHDLLAVSGIVIYLATWAYALYRVYQAEHRG